MAKTKSQTEETQKQRPPLSAFVHHQLNALEETGKAFASLLPKDFRNHAGKAVEEGAAGFNALLDGMKTEVERSVERIKRFGTVDEDDDGKVKVEVE
jgi:hypothetical protein